MLGVVVIGRNEGEKLRSCLQSVLHTGCPVVYADSGSSDGSAALADGLGVVVVALDSALPMNAARGRREGYLRLLQDHPELEYVLFLDGDCVLDGAFVPAAIDTMRVRPEVGVVCGRRSELYPESSVYHRIADLEWNTPVGERHSCGGDAMFRVSAYMQAGGFDETVLAGEEPELCVRIRREGFKILRLDVPMSWHDMGMNRLSQWWLRGVRSGYGALDVRQRLGVSEFNKFLLTAWIWVLGWPLISMLAVWATEWWLGQSAAVLCVFFVLAVLPLQVLRIARSGRRRGLVGSDAWVYGALMMVNKLACARGQIAWLLQSSTIAQGKKKLSPWQEDLLRYPPRPFLKEQSIWAIAVYRWGHELFKRPDNFRKRIFIRLYWLCFRLTETLTGISLPHDAKIGGGLRIHHFGNIFINPGVEIGENCTIRQGVTIGNRAADGPVPRIGSNVDFGAYAQVLGGVCVGDGARIGAMSVVLVDVPEAATAVGVPAVIKHPKI